MKTKRYTFLCLLLLWFGQFKGLAQIKDPVKWSYAVKPINATDYMLVLRATIEKGWHIYSSSQPEGAISVPTQVRLDPDFIPVSPIRELGNKEQQTIPGNSIQYYYAGTVNFTQMIRLKNKSQNSIKGQVTYMACTDEQCLPAKVQQFDIVLEAGKTTPLKK